MSSWIIEPGSKICSSLLSKTFAKHLQSFFVILWSLSTFWKTLIFYCFYFKKKKGCLHQLQSNTDFAPSSACLHKSQLEVGGGTLASSTGHSLDSDIGPLGGTWLQSGRESELTRRVTEEESCLLSSWTNVILSQTTDKWVSQTWDSNFFQTLQTVRAICPYERYLLMES